MQTLSFQRWLQIATEVFRKDSRNDAWLSSYQESNKLMQRIKSSCSSSKTKSRSTKSNSKSTQVHSRLRKKNVYWATHKRSVNFSTERLGRATFGPSGAELDGGFGVKQRAACARAQWHMQNAMPREEHLDKAQKSEEKLTQTRKGEELTLSCIQLLELAAHSHGPPPESATAIFSHLE